MKAFLNYSILFCKIIETNVNHNLISTGPATTSPAKNERTIGINGSIDKQVFDSALGIIT